MTWPFPMLKYKYILLNKIYGSSCIKQHSETVRFEISKMLIAVLKDKFIIYYNFRHTFVRCCARVACPSPIPGATPLQVPAATHDDGRRLADEIYLSYVAYTVPAYVDY